MMTGPARFTTGSMLAVLLLLSAPLADASGVYTGCVARGDTAQGATVERSIKVDSLANLTLPEGLTPTETRAASFLVSMRTTAVITGPSFEAGVTEYDCEGATAYDVYVAKVALVAPPPCLRVADACASRSSTLGTASTTGTRRESQGSTAMGVEGVCAGTRDVIFRLGSEWVRGTRAYCVLTGAPYTLVQVGTQVTETKDGVSRVESGCRKLGPSYASRGHARVDSSVTTITFMCPGPGPAAPPVVVTPPPVVPPEGGEIIVREIDVAALVSERTQSMSHIVFKIHCNRLVTTPLDPIVNPGTMSSHAHDIIGNVRFSSSVTPADLAPGGATTCDRPQDHSMYWFPSLYLKGDDGRLHLVYSRMVMYYFTQHVFNMPTSTLAGKRAKIHAFPLGLRMVIGDASNKNAPVPGGASAPVWRCHVIPTGETTQRLSGLKFDRFPVDPGPDMTEPGTGYKCTQWQLEIPFPNCWDGVNLDSPDHRSHMAYTIDRGGPNHRCPDSHPVPLPEIFMEAVYHIKDGGIRSFKTGTTRDDYFLSTNDNVGGSAHADVISGWDVGEMVGFLNSCEEGRDCGLLYQAAADRQPTGALPAGATDGVAAFPGAHA